jgi:hypothetical protein
VKEPLLPMRTSLAVMSADRIAPKRPIWVAGELQPMRSRNDVITWKRVYEERAVLVAPDTMHQPRAITSDRSEAIDHFARNISLS